ncbi:MAG: energy transducer TonB [Pyrinomonadaceae bacterium]|nr:energy transducer TonB [Pyrinomonadaceae bacterium]
MKTHKLLLLVLFVAIYASVSSFSPALGNDEPDNPLVVQAVPPTYPPIARAANVSGVVLVEVKIDARGYVTAVRIIEGHKLLTLSAEKAARKWKFYALDKAKERSVQLRFEFILIATNKGTPDDLGIVFWPPYKVEIRHAPYSVD